MTALVIVAALAALHAQGAAAVHLDIAAGACVRREIDIKLDSWSLSTGVDNSTLPHGCDNKNVTCALFCVYRATRSCETRNLDLG